MFPRPAKFLLVFLLVVLSACGGSNESSQTPKTLKAGGGSSPVGTPVDIPVTIAKGERPENAKLTTTAPVTAGDRKFYTGLIAPSPHEYFNSEKAKMIRSFANAEKDEALFSGLPDKIDLADALPYPGDQGNQNSCTAWSTSYSVKTFLEYRKHRWALDNLHVFSPAYVYNQINEGKDEGAELTAAIELIRDKGTVPLHMMPYDDKNFKQQPPSVLKEIAKGFRILDYRTLNETNVSEIKSVLATGEPVVLVVEMFENFLMMGIQSPDAVYREKKGKSMGYHAIVGVGYDNSKKAIKILNSWGPLWGEKGYGWIDEKFWPEVIVQAFVMYDYPTTETAPESASSSQQAPAQPVPKPPAASPRLTIPSFSLWSSPERMRQFSPNTIPRVLNAIPITLPPPGEDDLILIVPHEGGIKFKNRWLRLGMNLDEAKDFFSEKTSPLFREYQPRFDDIVAGKDFFREKQIGAFDILSQQRLPIATNDGIALGAPQSAVHRVYGQPDHTSTSMPGTPPSDFYFLHAITEDWGGIPIARRASLSFGYDNQQQVDSIKLAVVFKETFTGEWNRKVKEEEKKKTAGGTVVESKGGGISFLPPTHLSEIKKSVWGESGFGYFLSNPAESGAESVNVKVFFAGEKVDDEILNKRIDADLAGHGLGGQPREKMDLGGLSWIRISDGETRIHLYASKGKSIYQVQIVTGGSVWQQKWLYGFLNSIKIK